MSNKTLEPSADCTHQPSEAGGCVFSYRWCGSSHTRWGSGVAAAYRCFAHPLRIPISAVGKQPGGRKKKKKQGGRFLCFSLPKS